MSADVYFYKYKGNPKKINKTFSNTYSSKTINPTDFVDDQEPQLILNYDSTIYSNANYAKIGSDCYFIKDRGFDTAHRMVLFLKKDLLTTYLRNKNIPVIINRSSNTFNSYINDSLHKGQVNYTSYKVPFPATGGFSYSSDAIMVCAIGGEGDGD